MSEARNRALLDWYQVSRRPLPWRTTVDPWPILVSEVMAQQTQVSRVAPRFEAFVEQYPTPGAFARASDLDSLAMWAGLGYNSRALRLRDAARVITADGWPDTPEGLAQLPGVGPYTAAAVACFAFGHQVPAVDTNLRRVLSRWTGTHLTGVHLQAFAQESMASGDAADWNQAVMDLGALLCKPKQPDCQQCPVAEWCADPGVYEPAPTQGVWVGSNRQARGAIVRALLRRPHTSDELVDSTELDQARCELALASLVADGVVRFDQTDTFAIAG